MGRLKSLLTKTKIDRAKKAHNCQGNSNHRIQKGDLRLKVRNGRNWDHYCNSCGSAMLKKDITTLTSLQSWEVTDKE